MLDWRERSFLVADFEYTTHDRRIGRPRAFFQEVIEVGAVLLTPPGYCPDRSLERFVRPRFFPRLTEACRNIAMISQEDVDGGMPFEDMLTEMSAWYEPGKTFLVFWGDDRKVIEEACQRYKAACPFDWSDLIDLADAYKRFYGLPRRRSLKDAVDEQKVETAGYWHIAVNDARNTALLLVHMIRQGWTPSA